jgi:transcriptional regulator with XRE-family HTH domain
MAGLDRERLATFIRNKMKTDKLSLRRAADLVGHSPATFSRLLAGDDADHTPDTDTLEAVAKWLGKDLSYFDLEKTPDSHTLADVAVHLHALPDLAPKDAEFIMSVVQLLYEDKRTTPKEE